MAAIHHLKVIRPAPEKCAVALPVRKPNAAYRSREHLTEREVETLIEAAKDNRWGHRDATMVLLAFRHGLRASELVDLRWEQVDLENAILHVRRVKQGLRPRIPRPAVSYAPCDGYSVSRDPDRRSYS